jgi:hypothetical protein
LRNPAILVDLESDQKIEVIPEYVNSTYRLKIQSHIEQLRSRSQAAGLEYELIRTDQPLDRVLREYLSLRKAGM